MVIAKTDIAGFTPRSAQLSEAELAALLQHHKELVASIVIKYRDGQVIPKRLY